MGLDFKILTQALQCKCPRCHQGDLYQDGLLSMELRACCPQCNLDLSKNDSADGPAVFLIFVLGFLLVPAALLLEALLAPPLWVHAVLWTVVALGLTLGALKPLKSYIIALQYKHRPGDWE
jgi:uncharacterized protein (DUF983 family)